MAFHILPLHHGDGTARAATSVPIAYSGAVLCWLLSAGVYIAARWAAAEMPPWTLCFWRLALAFAILLPIVHRHFPAMADLLRARPVELVVVAALGLTFCQGLIYLGLQYTTATTAGIIMALSPIITMVLAHFLVSEKMSVRQSFGAALSMIGMMFIVARGDLAALVRMQINPGELWIVCSAVTWGLYTVLLRRFKFDIERLPLLVLLLGLGAAVAAPLYAWELAFDERGALDGSGLMALAYVAGPGGALMYYLYNWSVDALGAARAGMLLYLQAAFVAVLAYLLLGESLHSFDVIGAAVIIAGLLTAMMPKRAIARRDSGGTSSTGS
ncbi:DMT family transporter [Mesorhizobium sp. LHD-90]|uniref:DMT family transporter n=1 Tax=Mesorhizobium sp. LHD-90 TaxID=3071414 RepID=UPI0027DF80F1|nr:DMT family transporter [Mesorhizobium sp. LHD-90]MDQ6437200.1 DMT family transporter [Mesorhizobium sp. LHD-90]